MKLRPFLVLGTMLILMGVNGYLLFREYKWKNEGIAPSEFQPDHIKLKSDPLLSLVPVPADREKNLKAFGLPDPMVKKTLDRIRDLEDRKKDRLKLFLESVDDPTQIEDAFCGQTQELRPRYGALRFLVEEEQSTRRAISIDRVSGFKRQKWSLVSPIDEVYAVAELGDDKHEDATLMAVAAIMLNREEDLLNGYKPWGRGFAATWSWEQVKKQYPGAEDRLVEYFALMHLTWELMAGTGGLCGE